MEHNINESHHKEYVKIDVDSSIYQEKQIALIILSITQVKSIEESLSLLYLENIQDIFIRNYPEFEFEYDINLSYRGFESLSIVYYYNNHKVIFGFPDGFALINNNKFPLGLESMRLPPVRKLLPNQVFTY